MNWRAWFQIGYGPNEFHRDIHVAWVIFLSYAITRIPQLHTMTWHDCQEDMLTVVSMILVALAKSYLTNNTPPPEPK